MSFVSFFFYKIEEYVEQVLWGWWGRLVSVEGGGGREKG
jgi:hypothetical protein